VRLPSRTTSARWRGGWRRREAPLPRRSRTSRTSRTSTSSGRADAAARSDSTRPAAGRSDPRERAATFIPPAVGRVCVWHCTARPLHDVERERPQVVTGLAAIDAQRILRALAFYSHDAAARWSAGLLLWLLNGWRRLGRDRRIGWLRSASDVHHLEFPIFRHGVFVLFPKVPAIDQHVDARWKRVGNVRVLEPVKRNRTRVLLAAEGQLGFFLSTGFLTPDGHEDRHQNPHDGQRDKQRRHRVTPLAPPA
jgi:hypothetical protein